MRKNTFQISTLLLILLATSMGRKFVPQVNPGTREPACAQGRSYCLNIDDYPWDIISNLVRSAAPELASFFIDSYLDITNKGLHSHDEEFTVDFGSNTSVEHQNMSKRDEQLCQSIDRTIEPLAARDEKHNWRYIVNIPGSIQTLQIETCKITHRKCNELATKVLGFCEQKMMARNLLALDPSGNHLIVHNAILPSCCQCTLYDG